MNTSAAIRFYTIIIYRYYYCYYYCCCCCYNFSDGVGGVKKNCFLFLHRCVLQVLFSDGTSKRKMPCRCQPRSLFELSEDAVASGLVSTCYEVHELTHRGGAWTQARTLAFARHQVRPFWNLSVPSPVRRRVLNKCMDRMADAIREGHSISSAVGSVSLYLLHVILNTDISDLRVQLCCYYGCSHQAALLKLLATDACKGLVSLELARQTLFSLGT